MTQGLTRRQAAVLGFMVFCLLGVAAFGLCAIGSRQWLWGDILHVRAGFNEIRGVEVGTRVRVQGIEAGEVDSVQPPLQPGEQVVVRMKLDGKMRQLIRADATVQIVGEGMIGGKVLEIHPGSAQAIPVAEHLQHHGI